MFPLRTWEQGAIPLHPQKDAGYRGKCPKRQISQSVLILKATDTEAVRTAEDGDVGATAAEVQVAAGAAIHRTGPVVADAACDLEGPIAEVAVPRHNKLQG
ncbi:MAG: hypothetical protein GY702_27540 [Desulfobulbaceae bacterium]|nr:hypothetical protein [Desulfobulbaceae bacterium]